MSGKAALVALLGTFLVAGYAQESSTSATTAAPPQTSVTQNGEDQIAEVAGVDLSKWQGEVDFVKIKSVGKRFVFVKATQGNQEVDPDYSRNIQGARAAGLAVGSYHFYMTDDQAEVQFANFSKYASVEMGDLPPVVDIEVLSHNSLPDLAAELKRFLDLMESRYGAKPIIYSGEYFANDYLQGFADYPLWLAEYNKDETPKLPLDWKTWTFWQHSQSGSVPGVSGAVDLNRFNGTQEQLDRLLIRKP